MSDASIDGNGVTAEQGPWGRDRRKAIEQVDLAPESLVGSWFVRLEADVPNWQGLVIGEPQPGAYLVELEQGSSLPDPQRVISLVAMVGENADDGYAWLFFDSQEQMHDYASSLRLAAR